MEEEEEEEQGGRERERVTLTGHGKRKCLESWNFSISKSLTPQSLFEAVKWTAPLEHETNKEIKKTEIHKTSFSLSIMISE